QPSPLTYSLSAFLLEHPPTHPLYTLSLHDALPICTTMRNTSSRLDETDAPSSTAKTCSANGSVTAEDGTTDNRSAISSTVGAERSEEHTSELQSRFDLVCRLLLEKKNTT